MIQAIIWHVPGLGRKVREVLEFSNLLELSDYMIDHSGYYQDPEHFKGARLEISADPEAYGNGITYKNFEDPYDYHAIGRITSGDGKILYSDPRHDGGHTVTDRVSVWCDDLRERICNELVQDINAVKVAPKSERKVVLEETIYHEFYIDASSDKEALEEYEYLCNEGKLDFSAGEVTDSKLYVDHPERKRAVWVEIEHYLDDNHCEVSTEMFDSLDHLSDYMFDTASLTKDLLSDEPKPHVYFGKIKEGEIMLPISYNTDPRANGYDTHWIRTIKDKDGSYLYSDGMLTAGKKILTPIIKDWTESCFIQYQEWGIRTASMVLPGNSEAKEAGTPLLKEEMANGQEIPYRYTAIVTCENDRYPLSHFSDNPWEGILCDVIHANTAEEMDKRIAPQEGRFYQLYANDTGERIGYGMIDISCIREDIVEYIEKGKNVLVSKDAAGYEEAMLSEAAPAEAVTNEIPIKKEEVAAYEWAREQSEKKFAL